MGGAADKNTENMQGYKRQPSHNAGHGLGDFIHRVMVGELCSAAPGRLCPD